MKSPIAFSNTPEDVSEPFLRRRHRLAGKTVSRRISIEVLGFLLTVGFFVAYLTVRPFLELSFKKAAHAASDWALRNFRLFFPALSFAVIGFTSVFEWDMLFPDRRDFLIVSLAHSVARDFCRKVRRPGHVPRIAHRCAQLFPNTQFDGVLFIQGRRLGTGVASGYGSGSGNCGSSDLCVPSGGCASGSTD